MKYKVTQLKSGNPLGTETLDIPLGVRALPDEVAQRLTELIKDVETTLMLLPLEPPPPRIRQLWHLEAIDKDGTVIDHRASYSGRVLARYHISTWAERHPRARLRIWSEMHQSET